MSGNNRNRKNWTKGLTILMLVAVVGAVIGCLAKVDETKTDRVYLRSSAGSVLFDHGKHSKAAESCAKCHHELSSAEQVTSDEDIKPASCRECHPGMQPAEKNTISCQQCHDDDFTPDMLEHDEYLEVEDHTCLGCHTPQSVSQVYHLNCTNCHLETLPNRFTNKGGDVSCGACHLR